MPPLFIMVTRTDSNPSKCNADEHCPLRLDAAEPLFCPYRTKCKSSPATGTNKRREASASLLLFFTKRTDLNPSKCKCPVDTC